MSEGQRLIFVVTLVLCFWSVPDVDGISVKTSVGEVIGKVERVEDGTISRFVGIPFAESPVGSLRFKAPVKKAPFARPFLATEYGAACPQSREALKMLSPSLADSIKTSEDCLNLNVHVPGDLGETDGGKRSVMVWIHGGGFELGTGFTYDPAPLVLKGDVIVVTINYRIGLLGFFSTGDAAAPGNYGLLDQHMALQWVQENIAAFGGDPGSVTIFGESAGGASVAFQAIAPQNKGLFKRAIAQSGTANCPWGAREPDTKYPKVLAEKAGCDPNVELTEMIECLRQVSVNVFDIENAGNGWPFLEDVFSIPGGPRVDGDFISVLPFDIDPDKYPEVYDFFKSIDFIIGVNKYEGSPFISMAYEPALTAMFNVSVSPVIHRQHFELFMKIFDSRIIPDEDVMAAIWWLYSATDDYKFSRDRMSSSALAELVGDHFFYVAVIEYLRKHVEVSENAGSTYFYHFLPRPSFELLPRDPWNAQGAQHGDELAYFFNFEEFFTPISDRDIGEEGTTPGRLRNDEYELAEEMITYWTNFAKSGNPNEPQLPTRDWPQYSLDGEEFIELDIKNEAVDIQIRTRFRNLYITYWNDVVNKLRKRSNKETEAPEPTKAPAAKTEL